MRESRRAPPRVVRSRRSLIRNSYPWIGIRESQCTEHRIMRRMTPTGQQFYSRSNTRPGLMLDASGLLRLFAASGVCRCRTCWPMHASGLSFPHGLNAGSPLAVAGAPARLPGGWFHRHGRHGAAEHLVMGGASTWTAPALRRSHGAERTGDENKISSIRVSTVQGQPRISVRRAGERG